MAAPCRACIRSRSLIDGCALSGLHSQPLLPQNLRQGPNPSIRGVGAPMDGLSALPWTARWRQGTLPCREAALDGKSHSCYRLVQKRAGLYRRPGILRTKVTLMRRLKTACVLVWTVLFNSYGMVGGQAPAAFVPVTDEMLQNPD